MNCDVAEEPQESEEVVWDIHRSESMWRNPQKSGLVRGHDKLIHGSCAIYFPGGVV